jgi:hypothetical protein
MGDTVVLSEATRQYYRLYCLNDRGKIVGVEETHCDDDDSACAHARSRLAEIGKCMSIEVWNYARRVGQIERD